MGVRILSGEYHSCLYCSTTDWAFGPLFDDDAEAEDFIEWLGNVDPRLLTDKELEQKVCDFRTEKGGD